MSRISRHSMFMQCAEVVSRRSTCFRRNVGAIITADHNIVSVGYNGPASGEEHCTGANCPDPEKGCTRAIHAEKNAIDYIQFDMHKTRGSMWRMYVTESPCAACAVKIVEHAWIDEVYFLHQYRLTAGCDFLVTSGIKLYRLTPAGHVIDWKSNELIDEG